MMRDFASCFGDHAIKVADASCSGRAVGGVTAPSAAAGSISPSQDLSVQSVITSIFRAKLCSGKPLLIVLTWSRSHVGPVLSVGVDDDRDFAHPWNLSPMNSQLLRKKKGTHSFVAGSSAVVVHWDFSAARHGMGPEPIDNFFVAIIVETELALLLGDQIGEFMRKLEDKLPVAGFSMVCRREHVVGRSLYSSTRARFDDGGKDHEITISCKGAGELFVCVDKKRVVHVARLSWNFRGNQTIFVNGSPVDLMWDMHEWCFGGPAGSAVFLFRRRSSLESRLWLEEEKKIGFSLLIQAFRRP
ncbi:hypothetical protein AXF42_Ash020414 [Apostasia shenzhenica]|uniref:DUF868 domain-containing protein n=1 Tax=Apostasia shenzhenica TaxID=1088818 RepID=A0A2I0AA74_9ASPA|nr:hypothetical protein AXF42_Ash020414 [Apostasia shenzhenica]